MAERRDASALLAGCHPRWRHQRPEDSLLTRPDWHHLLPLVAQVQRQRPNVALPTMLTDRVRSARSLPAVLAWRLWQLLRQPPPQHTPPEEPARPHPPPKHVEESDDRHLAAVRTLGGPAAVRAALTTAPWHHLFESSWKKPYSTRGVRAMLARYAAAAGLPHHMAPHRRRHFLFTWLKTQGIDNALIQPYSGHASRGSLEIYSRLALTDAQHSYDDAIRRFPV